MNHKLFLLAALVSTALTMPSHVASRSVCPVPGDSVAAKTRTDTLREVTVKATRLLFVTRKDTVIYDLDAVAQQEGDVLADIVGRMPGLELRGGVLYFKGRMVQRVMVNGVDFERGDTRKAIENLPAYMVKSIKAYERQSDRAMMTGIDDGTREQTIDIILCRRYLGTWAANADAGGGPGLEQGRELKDNYWLLRGFASTFTDRARFSAMGGGTNTGHFQMASDGGDWGDGNSLSQGHTRFIRPSFSGFWQNRYGYGKARHFKVEYHGEYDYRRHNDHSHYEYENFYDTGNQFSNSDSRRLNHEAIYSGGIHLEYNLTDTTWLTFRPTLSWNHMDNLQDDLSATWATDTINTRQAHSTYDRGRITYKHDFYFNHRLSARRQVLEVRHSLEHQHTTYTANELTRYRYPSAPGSVPGGFPAESSPSSLPSLLNRYRDNTARNLSTTTSLTLNQPLPRTGFLTPSYTFLTRDDHTDNRGFRLDTLGGIFAQYADYLAAFGTLPLMTDWQAIAREAASTLRTDYLLREHQVWANWRIVGDQHWHANVTPTLRILHEVEDYQRGFAAPLHLRRNLAAFDLTSLARLTTDSIGKFELRYNFNTDQPSMLSLVDIPNTENPLYITAGNPDLRPMYRHSLNFRYDRNWPSMSYLALAANYYETLNSIATHTLYNPATGVTRTWQANTPHGNRNATARIDWSHPLDRQRHLLLKIQLQYRYGHTICFQSTTASFLQPTSVGCSAYSPSQGRYTTHEHTIDPTIGLQYQRDKLFILLGTNVTTNWLRSSNASVDRSRTLYWASQCTIDYTLPFDLRLRSHLVHIYRNDNSAAQSLLPGIDYDHSHLIWNLSLQRSFLRSRRLTVKLEAVDLFGQQDMNGVGISPTRLYSYYSETVGRYMMAHLIYRFEVKPKKQ